MARSLTEAEASEDLDICGGYMVRTGDADGWIVVDEISLDRIDGYRDGDAYGVDLYAVTEDQWTAAGWREDRLPGYRAHR